MLLKRQTLALAGSYKHLCPKMPVFAGLSTAGMMYSASPR